MSMLFDLIRKPISRRAATAISAIPATRPVPKAATVARIATVAVARPQKIENSLVAAKTLRAMGIKNLDKYE